MSSDHEHLLERGDALGRLALLIQAQDSIEDGQADDDEPGGELLQRDHADGGGADEDELHQVAVLAEKRLPARLLLRFRELVRADLLTTALDLGSLEPARRVDAELRACLLRRHAVPHRRVAGVVETRRQLNCHAASSRISILPHCP